MLTTKLLPVELANDLKPLWNVETYEQAVNMLDLDIARVCFFHNALAWVCVLNKDDNSFKLVEGWMYFPDVFNKILGKKELGEEVTISEFFDLNWINILDESNFIDCNWIKENLPLAISKLKNWESLNPIVLNSIDRKKYFSFFM